MTACAARPRKPRCRRAHRSAVALACIYWAGVKIACALALPALIPLDYAARCRRLQPATMLAAFSPRLMGEGHQRDVDAYADVQRGARAGILAVKRLSPKPHFHHRRSHNEGQTEMMPAFLVPRAARARPDRPYHQRHATPVMLMPATPVMPCAKHEIPQDDGGSRAIVTTWSTTRCLRFYDAMRIHYFPPRAQP